MFTGLVETTARLARMDRKGGEATMRFEVRLEALELGESISCSGVCLTVTRFDEQGFEADVSMETLAVTTLGKVALGERVNIERACRADSRLGGHLVLGHVDGVGRVVSLEPVEDAKRFLVDAPVELARFWAAKGSVAVDGVSLTINALREPSGSRSCSCPTRWRSRRSGERCGRATRSTSRSTCWPATWRASSTMLACWIKGRSRAPRR